MVPKYDQRLTKHSTKVANEYTGFGNYYQVAVMKSELIPQKIQISRQWAIAGMIYWAAIGKRRSYESSRKFMSVMRDGNPKLY
eukprot:1607810-Amphidinium_carterae.1